MYADDTEVNCSWHPAAVDDFLSKISECVGAVSRWMKWNRLSLNCDKTSHAINYCPKHGQKRAFLLSEPIQSARDLACDLPYLRFFAVLRQLYRRFFVRCRLTRSGRRLLAKCWHVWISATGLPVYLTRRLKSPCSRCWMRRCDCCIISVDPTTSLHDALSPVHTGDYSLVADFRDSRRFRRL